MEDSVIFQYFHILYMVNNKLCFGEQRIQTFLATAEDVNINKYVLDVMTNKPQKRRYISSQFLYDI